MTKPTRRGDKGRANKLPGWLPEPLQPAPAEGERPRKGKKADGGPGAKAAPAKAGGRTKKPRTLEATGAVGAPPRQERADPHAEREAARYENPIASREVILGVLGDADGPLTAEQLAHTLGLTAPDRFVALSRRLGAMLRDGQLIANRRGGYAVARRLDLVPGTVIANPEGFGFLRTDAGGDDLFLPPAELRKVMHGDRVLASVTGVDRRGRREGAIVEVLERRTTRLIGRYQEEGGIGFVAPDDRRMLHNVMIPPDARGGARAGQLVVCEIVQPQAGMRPPFGRVLSVLGDRLTPSLVVTTAIHGHELPHEFPPEVLAEAARVPVEVPAEDAAGRVDLRDVPLVTIDGEDAKDFDDAVWCEPNRQGFRLIVAIADVSHYVKPGTPLDDEAVKRATSVYFPGFVVPMLPETLSNGICSLKPDVDRMCFVCDMQIDREGNVRGSKFYEAVMRSHARLTYTQVWNAVGDGVLDADREDALGRIGGLLPQVQRLHQLYHVLAKARQKRGAIEFESSETRFVIGPAGEVVQAGMLQRNDAHKLIEECMIAANVEAAKHLLAAQIPAPFRIHDRPPEQKYEDLLEFLQEFGLKMPSWNKVQPRDFTALLKKVRERPDAALIESVLLRSQSLAVYSAENVGHFGLALEAYAHFTSPIRRYPDLLVHRAIKYALGGGRPPGYLYSDNDMVALALQCSERERRATEAEREVDERFRAAWMEQHVGGQFAGTISGVTSFGLFVELDDSKVNGLVHVTQLPRDYYHFDPIRKMLSGERRGTAFRLGDRVHIQVLRASVEDRKIDFRLIEERDEPVAKQGRRKKDRA
ncbi:ribonuclease R [Coralloluteibacterium thermophilus]|uniref:Ribonuclease R n=1 Tax=Coralloluteibacterium thermophilum TaxID=2707049 RepID=A0ABV9NP07_9GAMM